MSFAKQNAFIFFYLGIGVQRRNLDIFLYGIQLLNIVLTTFWNFLSTKS